MSFLLETSEGDVKHLSSVFTPWENAGQQTAWMCIDGGSAPVTVHESVASLGMRWTWNTPLLLAHIRPLECQSPTLLTIHDEVIASLGAYQPRAHQPTDSQRRWFYITLLLICEVSGTALNTGEQVSGKLLGVGDNRLPFDMYGREFQLGTVTDLGVSSNNTLQSLSA